jgi:multicomponent Na+:H+ antiporter subunit E
LPVPSGMLVVPTTAQTDGEYAAVGMLTSLIVDSQIVDVDRERAELQYHAVAVAGTDPAANRDRINGPVEARIKRLTRP